MIENYYMKEASTSYQQVALAIWIGKSDEEILREIKKKK